MLIELIKTIIFNLFSSELYEEKGKCIEKIKLYFFRKKLTKMIIEYINRHDGTVLTTSDFELFLTHHNLIEHIFLQTISIENLKDKESFIKEQIQLFHDVQIHSEKNKIETNQILYEFISICYDEINNYFGSNLSINQKYIISKLEKKIGNKLDILEDTSKDVNRKIDEIVDCLSKENEINDKEVVWSIYQTLSKFIINGKIDEIIGIYPLLKKKSVDLENSVSYLLGIFSSQTMYVIDFTSIEKMIIDDRIYDDICRITIYVNLWNANLKELSKIGDRNLNLKEISQFILNDKKDKLYTVSEKEKDGIPYYTYSMSQYYPNDQWIVRRILAFDVYHKQFINGVEILDQIIKNSDNLLDKIMILEYKSKILYSEININKDSIRELYDEVNNLSKISDKLALIFKEKIYSILLRLSALLPNDILDTTVQNIPKDLYGFKDIQLMIYESKLRKNECTIEEILKVCMKHDEYWLFNNYLIGAIKNNPEQSRKLIEKYLFIIDKDPIIFFIYVQLINNYDSKSKAIDLLIGHEEKFGKYLDFWVLKLSISYDKIKIKEIVSDFQKGKLEIISKNTLLDFTQLLIKHKMYNDALKIIDKEVLIGNINFTLLEYKAFVLLNLNRELEALAMYNDIFESGNRNEKIIYYILSISCNNRRLVSSLVLSYAEKSDNPQLLMSLSSYYGINNDFDRALTINLKAMLRTEDEYGDIFNQYCGIHFMQEHIEKEADICKVDTNTVVYLKNNDFKLTQIYIIHSANILPQEPYIWGNAIHIYKETAIELGFFRKKIGDTINIDRKEYVIDSIDSLDGYFFNLCMKKMLANGEIKEISTQILDNDKIDTEQLILEIKNAVGDKKNNLIWLDQYKNLEQIPATFFIYKDFVRVTYFQLVSVILEDKSILFRENYYETMINTGKYIFSYSALVVLYKLGWTKENSSDYAIPKVLKRIICEETESVIRDKNREHATYMGFDNGRLFITEDTEEDKTRYMQDVVKYKKYCEGFYSIDNINDLHLKDSLNVKDVLGLVDYDALLISKNENRVLVTAEVVPSILSVIPEIDVQTICIADFLTNESDSIDELFSYIQKLIDYRFLIPFTLNTIQKIFEFYNETNYKEKERIGRQFLKILDSAIDDNMYKNVMLSNIENLLKIIKKEKYDLGPLTRCLIISYLKYKGQKILITMADNGEIITKIIDDKKQIK